MDVNDAITTAAWKAARRKLPGLPREGGMCLKLVRLIVESALELRSHEMYDKWLIAGTSQRQGTEPERADAARANPWASDMEASFKRLGWGVPFADRRPGDILCNYRAMPPYGHIAVLLDANTALENIDHVFRQSSSLLLEPALALTPVDALPWTLCARIQPDS